MSADATTALDERIATSLTGSDPITSSEVRGVLDMALANFRSLERDIDALDVETLSPTLTLAQAQAKRTEASEMRFRADRLDAACSALRFRVGDLEEAEERAKREARQREAIVRRDELAGEIADRYPVIVRELTSLAKRIADSNAECQAAGIPASAETMGRGIPANFMVGGNTLGTISGASLPMPNTYGPAWGNITGSMVGAVEYPGLKA